MTSVTHGELTDPHVKRRRHANARDSSESTGVVEQSTMGVEVPAQELPIRHRWERFLLLPSYHLGVHLSKR
ncbi:hypothetical protein L915_19089 [Phytophthora nicotianae]|uniref:Uncharacterized protein n=1 Tax=Phytophthora nicotianae TaxID=4792 RepID=W2FVT4_PHYNI|nr:hypothetical protein L915_19089 [Phytophthora nicotianae]